MKLLGIDFGLSKIGLAVAESGLARPLRTVKFSEKTLAQIKKVCQEQKIEKIIIGLPEGEIGQEAKKFGQSLKKMIDLPIDWQDESLTTKDGLDKMIEAGKTRKLRQEEQNAFAAAVILQGYLERQKNNV